MPLHAGGYIYINAENTQWLYRIIILRQQNLLQNHNVKVKGLSQVWERLINLLKLTDYVMHHQFNIQQLYALPTLYLCVLYLSENKQRLVPLTA